MSKVRSLLVGMGEIAVSTIDNLLAIGKVSSTDRADVVDASAATRTP